MKRMAGKLRTGHFSSSKPFTCALTPTLASIAVNALTVAHALEAITSTIALHVAIKAAIIVAIVSSIIAAITVVAAVSTAEGQAGQRHQEQEGDQQDTHVFTAAAAGVGLRSC